MANTSVSGLVSGLDTSAIISQLMQIEAQPQTDLKNRVTTETSAVTALQSLNSKLAAISTKASDLAKLSAMSPTKATSDTDGVTVTAGTSATAGSVSFHVETVASAFQATYGTGNTLSDNTATPGTPVTITFTSGKTATVTPSNGSLSALAAALNDSITGVTATLVRVGTDSTSGTATYAVKVTSQQTGDDSFAISQQVSSIPSDGSAVLLGANPTETAGSNAKITIAGSTIEQASNTFTGLMPGVDVTVSKTGDATVTVSRDTQSVSDAMKSLVDSVNAVLDEVSTDTAYNSTTKKGGVLSGDSSLRQVSDKLLSLVTQGVDGKSLASVGLQVDRSGHVTFDATAFQNSYNSDPAGTIHKLALDPGSDIVSTADDHIGFVAGLANLTKTFSDPYTGTITSAITGRNASIKSMNDSIADWDTRLLDKQTALQRQYAALEVALGKMQDQASWLNGQISSLPSSGS